MATGQPVSRKKLFVSHKDESIRMFKSDFMDFFSRVHYSVPLIIYTPIILAAAYLSFFHLELGFWKAFGLWVGGMAFWSFTEYMLHRFVFHYHPKSKIGQRIHFIAHGVHHDYPNDSLRLVLPPSISVPLAFLFFGIFYAILGFNYTIPFYGGFVMGYLLYDELHYATHHANIKWAWFQKLKKHHMKHHYQDPDMGFGVSSPVWDFVFKTQFEEPNQPNNEKQ